MTSQDAQVLAPVETAPLARGDAEHSIIRFLRFLAAGGFAALVNLVSRYLLTPVIGFEVSIVVAYLLGMVVAFTLFRMLVFDRSGASVAAETYRFVIVNLIAMALVWIISVTLADAVFPATDLRWHAEDVAHFIGTCVPAISSYIGHSMYTFKQVSQVMPQT
jgi:putative flippase GtrA